MLLSSFILLLKRRKLSGEIRNSRRHKQASRFHTGFLRKCDEHLNKTLLKPRAIPRPVICLPGQQTAKTHGGLS